MKSVWDEYMAVLRPEVRVGLVRQVRYGSGAYDSAAAANVTTVTLTVNGFGLNHFTADTFSL